MKDTTADLPNEEAGDGPPVPEGIITALSRLLRELRDFASELRDLVTELRQNDRRQDALLDYERAAHLLGVSERKVKRYVADGDLQAIDLGGSVRIHPASLDAFIRRQVRGQKRLGR